MGELMFPKFIQVRNCIVLRDRHEKENFEQWWTSEGGNSSAVEKALNRLHLWDMFEPSGIAEERGIEALAKHIAIGWKSSAEMQFGDRDFEVEIAHDYGPTVVMFSRQVAG